MRESHRTFLSVLGIYLGGSWIVLQVVDVLKQNLGLPPWTFSLALTLLVIGLPIVLATAWLQSRVRKIPDRESSDRTNYSKPVADRLRSSSPRELFTWRNAVLGGLAAMALWGVFATAWLIRDRTTGGEASIEESPTVPAEGPTGILRVETRPTGVAVEAHIVSSAREATLTSAAIDLGSTPLSGTTLPAGETLLRLTGPDLTSLTLLVDVSANDTTSIDVALLPDSPVTSDMVLVPAGPSPLGVGGMPIDTFLIDRHETTNRSFAAFMADDGYATQNLWPDSMVVDSQRLVRSAALSRFVDQTGAPGPRTWSGAVFPTGAADRPVNGVSWYESRAYCTWRGKRLPSVAQWWRAALGSGEHPYPWGKEEASSTRANFEASGTVLVESLLLGVSPFGAFEMAGNVREWLRPPDEGAGMTLSAGGSWQDPVYTFSPEWREELPLGFANETTGFRCVRHN